MSGSWKGVQVASPVTGGKAELDRTLDAGTIVERYAAIGLDVGKTYAGRSEVAIFRCVDTGYRFFHPASLAGEADFYDQLHRIDSPISNEQHKYRDWSEDFDYALRRIVPGESLLDVGCGDGAFLKRASKIANATGIDGSDYAHEQGGRLGLDIRKGMIADFSDEFSEHFDTVCGFQILEHIYDAGAFVEQLIKVVKPGGRLILAVPNNEPFLRRFDPYSPLNCPPHHVGLWNRESLEKLADVFGLVPTDHQYCEVSGRWTVEAYLRARYMLGITQEIHQHSLGQKLKMAMLAPYTVPMSLIQHWRTKRNGTRNVIAMTFLKA